MIFCALLTASVAPPVSKDSVASPNSWLYVRRAASAAFDISGVHFEKPRCFLTRSLPPLWEAIVVSLFGLPVFSFIRWTSVFALRRKRPCLSTINSDKSGTSGLSP
ncbi:hypothetical protein RRG08_031945 [Elysia crispata]|uniref:Secreted protein n=1 Tax=Elysia crispata TaxID=231223 RepID=A0AAE1AQ87_9GAST|nr:hypothetical protein RRG08_031945 [Elysia crispata]